MPLPWFFILKKFSHVFIIKSTLNLTIFPLWVRLPIFNYKATKFHYFVHERFSHKVLHMHGYQTPFPFEFSSYVSTQFHHKITKQIQCIIPLNSTTKFSTQMSFLSLKFQHKRKLNVQPHSSSIKSSNSST